MRFLHEYQVAYPRHDLWEILMDVHKVAACLAGVEELTIVEENLYRGLLGVKMGPVRLRFEGEVSVTMRDREHWIGILEANARDSKAGGGFKAALTMTLHAPEENLTGLHLNLDTTFLGRIGELGRPLIKKKINGMMDDFIDTLNARHVSPAGAT